MVYSPIEDVSVEPGVHAFAWTTRAERSTASHHHVEHAGGNKVIVLVADPLQSNHNMR